jgi:hypothetical protein
MDKKYLKLEDTGVHNTFSDTSSSVRIALLRLIFNLQARRGMRESDWEEVDDYLEKVRVQSPAYKAG